MEVELNLDKLIEELSAKEGKPITQQEIAERAGIDGGQLSRYVNNRTSSINFEALGKLYAVFGIDPGPMFRFKGERIKS